MTDQKQCPWLNSLPTWWYCGCEILSLGTKGVNDHANKMTKAGASVCLLPATALNTGRHVYAALCLNACTSIY